MGYFEGLLGGFEQRRREVDDLNRKQAELSAQREGKFFETLLASPDAEMRALAVTGMLEASQPRKKKGGFKGFLGEYEQNPIYQRVLELANTPVESQEQVAPPTSPGRSTVVQGGMAPAVQSVLMEPPPQVGAAAQSPTALTSPNAPPPPPVQWRQTPGAPATMRTVQRPREIFQSPEDQAISATKAGYLGRARGLQQAFREAQTPDEQRIALELSGYNAPAAGSAAGQFLGNVMGANIDPQEWAASGATTPPDPQQGYRRHRLPDGRIAFYAADLLSEGAPTVRQIAGPDGRPMLAHVFQDGRVQPLVQTPATRRYLMHMDPAGNVTYMPVSPYMAPTAGTAPPVPVSGGSAAFPQPAGPVAAQAGSGGTQATPPAQVAPTPAGGPPRPSGGPAGISGGQRPVQMQSVSVARLDAEGNLTTAPADRNPRTGELFDPITGDSIRGQAFAITPAQQGVIQSQVQLTQQLSDIEALAGQLLPSTQDLASYAPGVWLNLKSAASPTFAAQYAEFVSAVNAAAGAIRRLQGQAGAESERDYARALSSLGQVTAGDTKEAVEHRLAATKSALGAAQKTYRDALQRASPQANPGGTPDLTGLQPGRQRRFTSGPYAGQVWTVDTQGRPQQVR